MIVTKRLDLPLLTTELEAASVPIIGLGTFEPAPGQTNVHTFDEDGEIIDLPPEAAPVVDAHVAPPRLIDYTGATQVDALTRTTDATAHEVFRFPCAERRLYQANLTISGIDAVSFASKVMEGRFTWKRNTGNAIVVGLTVVSDIHDTAAASWAPNYAPQGTDIVFTVAGAAGRTIDWALTGSVGVFAPAGVES